MIYVCYIFFFQAEDGIRDHCVTGVQTCAFRSPQAEHLKLLLEQRNRSTSTQCSSFTAGTTRVSNPVRSPSFRASASDLAQRTAFATGILLDIYAFHRYTKNSVLPYEPLAQQYRRQFLGCAEGFHLPTDWAACAPFKPSDTEQR